jgi:enoyl-CoA hydratase/carnithine racemase
MAADPEADAGAPTAPWVTVERRQGVALIRLDRPRANALSLAVLGELRAAVEGLTDDLPGAVVLWGGPRLFSAGAEVTEFDGPERAAEVADAFHALGAVIAALPRMVIAAVNGYALGGGCELALACDLRVAADDAKFGQPEILLGIIPGGGGTQRLPRLVGTSRAVDLMVTGRQVRGDEALAIGLADRVVAADAVLDEAMALASTLAAGAVVAQGLVKQAVADGAGLPLPAALGVEKQAFVDAFRTEDAGIGVASFVASGPGKAEFVGR